MRGILVINKFNSLSCERRYGSKARYIEVNMIDIMKSEEHESMHGRSMNGENWLLVTHEPIKFEKEPVEYFGFSLQLNF